MTRRVKTHIRLGIRSVSPSNQCPRCPHEETIGPYLSIAKFRGVCQGDFLRERLGVSPRTFAGFLRERSRSFSARFHGENARLNKLFLFFSHFDLSRAMGVPRQNAKPIFSVGLICTCIRIKYDSLRLVNYYIVCNICT